jgi:hypothetical protein
LPGLATAVAVLGSGAVFSLIKLWRYDQLQPIDQPEVRFGRCHTPIEFLVAG